MHLYGICKQLESALAQKHGVCEQYIHVSVYTQHTRRYFKIQQFSERFSIITHTRRFTSGYTRAWTCGMFACGLAHEQDKTQCRRSSQRQLSGFNSTPYTRFQRNQQDKRVCSVTRGGFVKCWDFSCINLKCPRPSPPSRGARGPTPPRPL